MLPTLFDVVNNIITTVKISCTKPPKNRGFRPLRERQNFAYHFPAFMEVYYDATPELRNMNKIYILDVESMEVKVQVRIGIRD